MDTRLHWIQGCGRVCIGDLGYISEAVKNVQSVIPNESLSYLYPWERVQTECCFVFSVVSYHQVIPQLKISNGSLLPVALSLNTFDKMSRLFIISLFPIQSICLVWVSILSSPSNFYMSRHSSYPFKAQVQLL